MEQRVRVPYVPQNRKPTGSLFLRLADRWRCQLSTARTRGTQSLDHVVAMIEESLALHDDEMLCRIMNRIDTALVGRANPCGDEALYLARRHDAEEDLAEAEFIRNPCKETAQRWYHSLGREGRSNEPAMAALREGFGV